MNPLVSIVCTTYNQEKYIEDAIKSFLMQKTSFDYEIIIHDDASTDDTAEIIKKYAEKYEDVIIPILQPENLYKQGIDRNEYLKKWIRGNYVATCEGDDYWTDNTKLQKQVDFLLANPQYDMNFHPVQVVDINGMDTGDRLGIKNKTSSECSISETGLGGAVHISSRVIKKSVYLKQKPDWFKIAFFGDYASATLINAEGRVFYIDEVMSAYRTGVENSEMTLFNKDKSMTKEINNLKNQILVFKEADEYYGFVYTSDFQKLIILHEASIKLLQKSLSIDSLKKYKEVIHLYGIVKGAKIFILFGLQDSTILNLILGIKQKLNPKMDNSSNFKKSNME